MSIRIYLLAETRLSGGLERFLIDRNLHWRQEDLPSDAEQIVEVAGRVCYMSFSDRQHRSRNDEYIANIIHQGHESVLEHANFTLLADGISRGLSHQLVRHRAGFSYSQLSQQYYDETPVRWAVPPEIDRSPEALDEWTRFIENTEKTYKSILSAMDRSSAPSDLPTKEKNRFNRSVARSVLPNAAATTLVVTGNARAWRYFLKVRGSTLGDLEMREYCVKIFEALASRYANLFYDYKIAYDALGPMVVRKKITNDCK